jgi:hypothetical protein
MIEITKAKQLVTLGGSASIHARNGPRPLSTVVTAFGLILLLILLCPASTIAASLGPATSKAWDDYVEFVNRRMEQRLARGQPFLWVDEAPDRLARVRAGEILVSPGSEENPRTIPSGLIHDWIGAIFIRDVTLADVMRTVSDYARYKDFYKPTVGESKPIASGKETDRFSMILIYKSLVLKTAFDTEYESRYVCVDEQRGYSISWTTRIQEVENYGASPQRLLPVGEGSGLIWRLFSTARYVERDGGVYVELNAVALSRDIPASFRWLVEPIVRRVSRGALLTTLQQTESAVHSTAARALRKAATGEAIAVADRKSTLSCGLRPVQRAH